jgi:hypothetical protein
MSLIDEADRELNYQADAQRAFSDLVVVISSCPHEEQRYDTCGDWYYTEQKALSVTVSELEDRRHMWLVAIHELIEAALCEVAGITERQVDDFDMHQEHEGEPGDQPTAPYYRQHQIASGIERLLAAEMRVDWLAYEKAIEELK